MLYIISKAGVPVRVAMDDTDFLQLGELRIEASDSEAAEAQAAFAKAASAADTQRELDVHYIIRKNGVAVRVVTDATDDLQSGETREEASSDEVMQAQAVIATASAIGECQRQRAARYDTEASIYDLADAETKLASLDPVIQAEGASQKAAVLALRLQIKAEIPKP